MCGSEVVGISFGLFIISVVTSIPFIIFTKLKVMFKKPGEFDNIAFCVEDLPQFGQVCTEQRSYQRCLNEALCVLLISE